MDLYFSPLACSMATRIALLNDGRVEQIGTPEQVYDAPASVFVAGFLGSPPMNLLDATVGSRDGIVTATGDGVDAQLWPGESADRAVILGFRPEHLAPVRVTDGPGARLHAVVESVENLGSEQIAYCAVGAHTVCVRAPRPIALHVGQTVVLAAPAERVHLFDAGTGRRLEWVDVPELTDFDTRVLSGQL